MAKVRLVGTETIHLQQIGKVKAMPAGEIQVGMVMVWNYGTQSIVKSISPKGKTSLVIEETIGDKTYERVCRKSKLIAAGWEIESTK